MNKVSQTFSLGRALLKTVNLWPLSGSQTAFIQNQISFFFQIMTFRFDVLLQLNMYILNANSLNGSTPRLKWHLVVGVV